MQRAFSKLAVVALAAIALYALAGYLLGPRLVRSWAESKVAGSGPHRLVVDEITADPFTFHVALIDTALLGPGDRPKISIPRADALVRPAGLAGGSLRLDHLTLYAPDVKLASSRTTGEEGSPLNAGLLRVMAAVSALPLPEQVDALKIVGGRMQLGDPAPGRASVALTDLDLHVSSLSAGSAELSPFEVAADLNRIARVEGTGRLGYREGRLRIAGDFSADDVRIAGPANGDAQLTADRLLATGVAIDTSRPEPSVGMLRLERPHLRLVRPARGGVSLPDLLDWLAGNAAAPIRRAEIAGGRASFTDWQVTPAVQLELFGIEGTMERDAAPGLEMVFEGRLAPSGAVRLNAIRDPASAAEATQVDLVLQGVELPLLSPYFEAAAGRGILAGRLDFTLRYTAAGDPAGLDSRIVVEQLRLADPPSPRGGWPLELAIALLEDPAGRIEIVLPLRTGPITAEAVPGALLATLRDRVDGLAASPFEEMARIAGRPDATLGALPFEPGSAEITPVAASRLEVLGAALMARPGLAIDVHPGLDPDTDRQALAARQVRLHVDLATSAPPGAAQQEPIELDDPRVRGILDEFGSTRLTPAIHAAISDRHPDRDSAYYAALFEALVANETVPDTALQRLARYRAQSVIDTLRGHGVSPERLTQGEAIETAETREARVLLRLDAHPVGALE